MTIRNLMKYMITYIYICIYIYIDTYNVVKTIMNHPPSHHHFYGWYRPSKYGWFMIVLTTLLPEWIVSNGKIQWKWMIWGYLQFRWHEFYHHYIVAQNAGFMLAWTPRWFMTGRQVNGVRTVLVAWPSMVMPDEPLGHALDALDAWTPRVAQKKGV